jgi:hypothetical protein
MAISIDWPTKVITVPKADTQLVSAGPPEIRALDLDQFRKDLNALQADVEGMPELTTHEHTAPVTVGGVTLARVVEIINGYTITFENGAYAVNLNGANSNIGDVVNLNSVSVRSSNSAGLTYSKEIEDQSFADGRIFLDVVDGLPGSDYPRGTTTSPVDNFTDATSINTNRNLPHRYLIKGSISLTSEDMSGDDWLGTTLPTDSIAFGGSTVTSAHFERLKLSGSVVGSFTARECVLENVSGFNGFLFGGAIAGTLTLAAGEAHVVNAYAAVTGTGSITIDYDGQAVSGFIPGWGGGLTITNHSNVSSSTAIDMHSGTVTIDSTCTDGTIVVRGVGTLVDNSGAGCTVVSTGLLQIDGDIAKQFVESGVSIKAFMQAVLAGIAGEASGATTPQMVFKNPAGTTTRITADHDGQGNRTSVTLNTG